MKWRISGYERGYNPFRTIKESGGISPHFSTDCTIRSSINCAICRFSNLCNLHKYTAKYLCNLPIDFWRARRLDGLGAPYFYYIYVTVLLHLCYNFVTISMRPIIGTRQPGQSPENFTTVPRKSQPLKILHFAQRFQTRFVQIDESKKIFSKRLDTHTLMLYTKGTIKQRRTEQCYRPLLQSHSSAETRRLLMRSRRLL
jgi:hypothetical protein